jgi:hypothetical protein
VCACGAVVLNNCSVCTPGTALIVSKQLCIRAATNNKEDVISPCITLKAIEAGVINITTQTGKLNVQGGLQGAIVTNSQSTLHLVQATACGGVLTTSPVFPGTRVPSS